MSKSVVNYRKKSFDDFQPQKGNTAEYNNIK